jgi:hypothetical protein
MSYNLQCQVHGFRPSTIYELRLQNQSSEWLSKFEIEHHFINVSTSREEICTSLYTQISDALGSGSTTFESEDICEPHPEV